MGAFTCWLFGYSHMLGGYAGGQAEYREFHSPMWGRLKCQMDCRMNRYCSFPTFSQPATWALKCAIFNPGHDRGVGLRTCRPVRHRKCLPVGAERVIAIDRFPVPASNGPGKGGSRDLEL